MTELRPDQKRGPAKKITREVLRNNPLLAALIRGRLKEIKAVQQEKKAWELDLD